MRCCSRFCASTTPATRSNAAQNCSCCATASSFAAGRARGQGGQGIQEFRRLPACRGAGGIGGQTERSLVQAHAGQGQSPCKRQSLRMWDSWGPEWPSPCRAVQPAGAGQRAQFHHRASTPPGLLRYSLCRAGMLIQATVPGSTGSVVGGRWPRRLWVVLGGGSGWTSVQSTTSGPVRNTRRILTNGLKREGAASGMAPTQRRQSTSFFNLSTMGDALACPSAWSAGIRQPVAPGAGCSRLPDRRSYNERLIRVVDGAGSA